jgi:flavin reductase (DIM6/NTAB) family NADH-FMN oxidoreductase RutF
MLAPDQAALSRRFADRVPLGGYGDVPIFESQPGVPILKGAMAGINAIVARLIPAGDHTIYLCGLGKCISRENPSPLLYCNRRYHELGAEVPAAS